MVEKVAVTTTVYPAVLPYLPFWRKSLLDQSDRDFDIWISMDAVDRQNVEEALGGELNATWISNEKGDTPAQVRTRCLTAACERYPIVVTIDSDDCMLPDRVERARQSLAKADLVSTAMQLIDEQGRNLNWIFGHTSLPIDWETYLVGKNVFGLSNSAWRSQWLINALPVPADCVLMDWLLATRILHSGGRLGFDNTPGILYRQYRSNTARVVPPFLPEYIQIATERVRGHLNTVVSSFRGQDDRIARLYLHRQSDVDRFRDVVVNRPTKLEKYVASLNAMGIPSAWWLCVAHPDLEDQWKR